MTDPTSKRTLRVYHDQLVVWASLAPRPLVALPAGYPIFPLLIDTGFNDAFLMQERQAEEWMTPAVVSQLAPNGKHLAVGSERIAGRDAALWLYSNVPGSRAPDLSGSPIRLALPIGAVLTPPGSVATREKPLLGLRAIRFNGLSVRIDGHLTRVWIDSP